MKFYREVTKEDFERNEIGFEHMPEEVKSLLVKGVSEEAVERYVELTGKRVTDARGKCHEYVRHEQAKHDFQVGRKVYTMYDN